jgi:hypothetical protein
MGYLGGFRVELPPNKRASLRFAVQPADGPRLSVSIAS